MFNIFSEIVCWFLVFYTFVPLNQSIKKLKKMKKVTFAVLFAGAAMFASCGGNHNAEAEQAKADSIAAAAKADSIAAAEAAAAAAAAVVDTTAAADTTAAPAAEMAH